MPSSPEKQRERQRLYALRNKAEIAARLRLRRQNITREQKAVIRQKQRELNQRRYWAQPRQANAHCVLYRKLKIGRKTWAELKAEWAARKAAAIAAKMLAREEKKRGAEERKRIRVTHYRQLNRDRMKEYRRLYYLKNKERIDAKNTAYRAANPEKLRAIAAAYLARKGDEIRKKSVERVLRRRRENPYVRLEKNLRHRLYTELSGSKKGGTKWVDLVGCTREEFKAHIERQFVQCMSWDNYPKWHVDHLRPCSSFDLRDPEQVRQCFHFSNLGPKWGIKNIRKGDSWDGQICMAI